jgi:hypothetical protein
VWDTGIDAANSRLESRLSFFAGHWKIGTIVRELNLHPMPFVTPSNRASRKTPTLGCWRVGRTAAEGLISKGNPGMNRWINSMQLWLPIFSALLQEWGM